MKPTFPLICLLGLCLFTTACNPKYYAANSQNVPLLSKKAETNLTVTGNSSQVEFQAAYGVGNSVGIQANGGLFIPKDLENGNGGSGKFLEVGTGYFKALQENLIFETYALLGFGSFENHLPSTISSNPQTTGDISAGLLRIGIQPAIGYKSKIFSAALSSRLSNLTYNNIEGNLIFDNQNQVQYLEDNRSNFLLEPALTLRLGVDIVKFQLQYGFSFNLSNIEFQQDRSFFTLGLNFNFD